MTDVDFHEIAARLEAETESLAADALSEACGGPNTIEYDSELDGHVSAALEAMHQRLYAAVLHCMNPPLGVGGPK